MRLSSDTCFICDASELEDPILFSRAWDVVSSQRRDLADSFVFRKDKDLSLAAGIFMRLVENEYGPIFKGPNGKPECKGLEFNISHSDRYTVFVSSEAPVGIDIEAISDNSQIYKTVMTPDEFGDFIEAVPLEERDKVFCRMWTAKESYMKALGTGMTLPPESFRVLFGDRICSNTLDRGLEIQELEAPEGYCMSVCSDHKGFRAERIDIQRCLHLLE